MPHCKWLRPLSLLIVVALYAPGLWAAPRYLPDQIIVKYKTSARASDRAALRASLGGQRLKDLSLVRGELVKVQGMTVEQAIERAKRHPHVEYAEPDWEIKLDLTPNDPRFSELWGMENTGQTGGTPGADISATNAWDLFTGSSNVLVGVIDTGIDYTHPDLAANAWTNPGEIPGNLIDDDNNGFVDDVHGYDFVNNDGDPMDDNDHGSHCSGTIGGVGNNGVGVAGVNWNVKIAGIKFLSAAGSGSTANAILSVQYAITIGATLTSNSWGGGGFSQALLDAINAAGAAGQLFVAAAGNSGVNTDASPHYPSAYNSPYIVSVMATDHMDQRAIFTFGSSNWGATTVDLGAPGKDILSTTPGNSYQVFSGTSMATPHVAGACAMVWGRFPAMTNAQVKARIMDFADPVPALSGLCITGARLNVFMAIADPDSIAPGSVGDLATTNPGSTTMGLEWTATGDDGGTGRASSYELRYSTAPIDSANFSGGTLVPTAQPQTAGSAESLEVGGLTYNTTYYFAMIARDEFGNPGPLSNVAAGTTLGVPDITARPDNMYASLLTGAQDTQTLTITNDGEGTLDFSIPLPEILIGLRSQSESKAAPAPVMDLGKNDLDPRRGEPTLAASGGPDAFGYRWIDSDEIGGPVFNWVDITSVGTQIGLNADDQNVGGIPIGFSFPFYGNSFTTLRACSNGWLSFTSSATSYSNQPLPTGGTTYPENLLAPFWDDLDFRATSGSGRAYYHNDGTRFILSYVNVPHYAASAPFPGPYTFQVILYPSGEIRYQYLSMLPPTDSATIGIQNAARDVGLQVAFNAAYVHDNLAVRIAPIQQWLTVAPASGRVLQGQSMDVDVMFDATGMQGGLYDARIHIVTNDPDENPADVPVQMLVTGAPNVVASGTFDYGTVFVGATPSSTLSVTNTGTDVLNVTSIVSSDPVLGVVPSSFSLAPGSGQNVVVTYAPAEEGTLDGTLTLSSNDPDQGTIVFTTSGAAIIGPDISLSSTSMGAFMQPNQVEMHTLRISNLNLADQASLTYTIGASVGKATAPTGPVYEELVLGKTDVDPRPGILGSGGPDAFGYRWKDSDEVGGPVFNWIDITGVGTPIAFTGDDQNIAGIPIGFSFPFYGSNFTTLNACTNGWLSFSSTATTYLNAALPTGGTSAPNNLIAPFWDDLIFTTSGDAYYYNDGSRLIVSYIQVPHYASSGSGTYTFQVILYPSGKIVYQYLDMQGLITSATLGIQNSDRTVGLQMVFNASYVHNGLAVQIQKTPEWLSVSQPGGIVPGAGELDLDVIFNSTDLEPGTYQGSLQIVSNDPDEGSLSVPVTLVVGSPTDAVTLPKSFELQLASGNPTRGATRLLLAVPKPEAVDVRIYNVKGQIVRQLAQGPRAAGLHPLRWDGLDAGGRPVASGVYFVKMHAGAIERTLRVTMMR